MQTVFLHDLIQMPKNAGVELHAVDSTIYLVFSAQGDSLLPVVGKNGERLRFPSRAAAQLALKEAGLNRLDFVHHSAYGEMVGLDDATGTTELRQTVDL